MKVIKNQTKWLIFVLIPFFSVFVIAYYYNYQEWLVMKQYLALISIPLFIVAFSYVIFYSQAFGDLYFKNNNLIQRNPFGIKKTIRLDKIDEITTNEFADKYVQEMLKYRKANRQSSKRTVESQKVILLKSKDKVVISITHQSFGNNWDEIKSILESLTNIKVKTILVTSIKESLEWSRGLHALTSRRK